MTAYEYLIWMRDKFGGLPYNVGGAKHKGIASNSDVRRLLENNGVIINGVKPKPKDEIELPVKELVFFPKGNRVTAI